jgi:hypothetical protein
MANTKTIRARAANAMIEREEKTMLSKIKKNTTANAVAPLLGAAGGTLIMTAAVERFGIPRERITLGGAMLAVLAARNTDGAIRDALTGVAAAGASLAMQQLLERLRPKLIYGDKPKPTSAPPDAISREDLAKALAELSVKHQAEAHAREEASRKEKEQVLALVRDLAARLAAANAEIERLYGGEHSRNASVEAQPAATTQNPATEHERDAKDANAPSAVALEMPPLDSFGEMSAADEPSAPPKSLDRLLEIASYLAPHEREQLQSFVVSVPEDLFRQAQVHLLSLPIDDAVRELRTRLHSMNGVALEALGRSNHA